VAGDQLEQVIVHPLEVSSARGGADNGLRGVIAGSHKAPEHVFKIPTISVIVRRADWQEGKSWIWKEK
jgi:hypothetical protein